MKNKRYSTLRVRFLYMALATALVLLTACGAANKSGMATQYAGEAPRADMMLQEQGVESSSMMVPDFVGGADLAQRKITKNISLQAKTNDVPAVYQSVLDWATSHDGYEVDSYFERSSQGSSVTSTINIPPQKLDEFVLYIDGLATIERKNVYTNDITAQYVETEMRLKSMRASLEAYQRLLSQAKRIEDIVSVQRAIDDVTMQIEWSQSSLNQWKNQLDFSVVTITLEDSSTAWWGYLLGGAGAIGLIGVIVLLIKKKNRQSTDTTLTQ